MQPIITWKSLRTSHNSRFKNEFVIPHCNLNLIKNPPNVMGLKPPNVVGLKRLNNIPSVIKESKNLKSFKMSVKNYHLSYISVEIYWQLLYCLEI